MLRSISEIIGYNISATDGEIGEAHDFLFDDQEWNVRHLVVDTGKWIPGRKVLIAPVALGEADWTKRRLPVSLDRETIEHSPSVDTDKSVSRQQEIELFRYFSWTPYWGAGLMGPYTQPAAVAVPEEPGAEVAKGDSHLRSVRHVKGYHISAADGEIGHIDDFILDDSVWVLRYAVVNTRNWLPGRQVLISPWWFKDIDWGAKKVATDLTQDEIRNGPKFDPTQSVNREQEERIYDYYGRPKYWGE